ncbi:hypothetical protein LTR56_012841 [Elasticomyces elasticus]|nr:hypothetical protein LTR56_012841 [Elasticomyces elasticus]KAK3650767.1 hypothetical protein LTR22_012366 [Elasticomyces elasticus]KAK4918471.1 hypothetical protein LTR49_013704 [Elasticomyces elasticus]
MPRFAGPAPNLSPIKESSDSKGLSCVDFVDPATLKAFEPKPGASRMAVLSATLYGSDDRNRLADLDKVLLDSGATHDCISKKAVQRLGLQERGLLWRLRPESRETVQYLGGFTDTIEYVVHLKWQLSGLSTKYDSLFRVVDQLPCDLVISFGTIETHNLFSKGLKFHQGDIYDVLIHIHALRLKRQSEGERQKQQAAAELKREENEALRAARLQELIRKALDADARKKSASNTSSST